MHDTTRPNAEERYGKAITSKRLMVEPDRRCDVDMLVAAGWVADTIATELLRLRQEFDAARGEYQQANHNAASVWSVARKLQAEGRRITPEGPAHEDLRKQRHKAAEAAKLAMKDAERQALTARALILVQLKSLHTTKQKLGAFSVALATKRRFMKSDLDVLAITGRALDYWLDPACPSCDGRGFHGGVGTPMEWCSDCHGTAKRTVNFGGSDADQVFGKLLLAEMDRKAAAVLQVWKKFLYAREQDRTREAASQEMSVRLRDLRSTQAQED